VTLADAGRKVIFAPGHVRVSGPGLRGIVPTPPPSRSPGSQGHGAGGQGKGQPGAHGKGQGNGLAALALALAATSASSGKVVPSPPDVPGAMSLICSQVLAVSTQTTFDTQVILGGAIPSTYSHLVGYFEGRTTADSSSISVGCTMLVNHDSGANYYRQGLQASDATIASSKVFGEADMFIGSVPGSAAAANFAGSVDFLIERYQSPFFKRARIRSAYQTATSGTGVSFMNEWETVWANTAAVTRLELIFGGVPCLAGSSFFLYGIT
jgi:hypothetical protein